MQECWHEMQPEQIARGYYWSKEKQAWICLECGQVFEQEEIFARDGRFYTAEKAAALHLQQDHPDWIEKMLQENKKLLSLTEKQEQLLLAFAGGKSDGDIAKEFGLAASTVRHQRFVFRERAKAARLYLAVWELVQQGRRQTDRGEELISIHGGATMVDSRYEITQEEEQKILHSVFSSIQPLRLKTFPPKEKKKVVILRAIAQEFGQGKTYTERQVNEILKEIFPDYVTLRRYLIEYGYLRRTRDGSAYWKN